MCADARPERVVDHLTMPTVAIFVLVDDDCVNVQVRVVPEPPPPPELP
jgi:hypothetical protein